MSDTTAIVRIDADSTPEPVTELSLVSVLVRSMNRASLPMALESIAAQTFQRIEVVVVNATGMAHAALPEPRAGLSYRLLNAAGESLSRSAAANVALAAVQGDLAIFLDDDDRLHAHHIERLVRALDGAPEAVAAYAGVECVDMARSGSRPIHVFDEEISAPGMQLANALPIHAVLFRVTVVEQGTAIRFSEELELFEDWDFWLQLLARGTFVRVPGVSAVYQLDANAGSGHAATAGLRRHAMLERFGARQLDRWTPPRVAEMIEHNAAVATRERHLQQALGAEIERLREVAQAQIEQWRSHAHNQSERIATLTEELRRLEAVVRDQDRQIGLAGHELASVYASRSWRWSKPVRWAGQALSTFGPRRWARFSANLVLAIRTDVRRRGWWGLLQRLPHYLSRARYFGAILASTPPVSIQPFARTTPRAPSRLPLPLGLAGKPECLDHKISVVIPTLNGGAEFAELLRKLRSQQAVREVELVVVDSGSTDGTVAAAHAANATVRQIAPSEFSHSHARNLGADAATGDHLLFMVQDASPMGPLWLHGMLRWLLDHGDQGVVAASCSETCRSDSDLMYDCMVQTHYRFLGCLEDDRIGQLTGADHMSLRSMGQLSDVACLIGRDLFMRYRYRGEYAEDLDLGIRLIKDGHRVAMLSSIKVIHSHNRPAYYYLKRSFVDVIFLVGMFDDFHHPACASVAGLIDGILATGAAVAEWLASAETTPERFDLAALHPRHFKPIDSATAWTVGDTRLDAFIAGPLLRGRDFGRGATPASRTAEARQFHDSFVARLDHLHQYLLSVYGPCDERLRREVCDAVRKTFAAALGTALAYVQLDRENPARDAHEVEWVDEMFRLLKSGV